MSSLQILSWPEVRTEVLAVNPALAKIIETLDLDESFPLIKCTYKFGELIIQDGKVQLPAEATLSDAERAQIQEQLNYSQVPLLLLLNKESEAFVMDCKRVVPLHIYKPGSFFGATETLNNLFSHPVSQVICNLSAGIRSIFTLPQISASRGLQRLIRQFNLEMDSQVHSLVDHWDLFRKISNHVSFSESWECSVLFFTRSWFSCTAKNETWCNFRNYLYGIGWQNMQKFLLRDALATTWKKFLRVIAKRRLKPSTYCADTFKHQLLIAHGAAPGFYPAMNSLGAPILGLQDAIANVYLLESYIPHILCAGMPTPGSGVSYYYSLSFPTLFEGTPDSKQGSSTIMADIKLQKLLLETLQRDLVAQDQFLQGVHIEYFHVDEDISQEIQLSAIIPEIDTRFLLTEDNFSGRFCATSPFWRGCIKITV